MKSAVFHFKAGVALGALALGAAGAVAQTAPAPEQAAPVPVQNTPVPAQVAPDATVSPQPGAVAASSATSANQSGLGDIVVTAQRRSERLQDIPVAITAVTPARLAANNAVTVASLPSITPTVNVQDSIGFVTPYIRGVGSTNVAPGTYSSVAIYVDGLYTARLTSGNFDLDNITSIQVLNGPQGALYGRNATGGAILVTTATGEPGEKTTGHVSASYGNYNDLNLAATVSGGLTDTLGFTISASRHTRDGFLRNVNPAGYNHDDGDDRNTRGVAGKIKWKPSSSYEATVMAGYSYEFDRTGVYTQADTTTPVPTTGLNASQSVILGTLVSLGVPPANAFAAASGATYPQGFREYADGEINGFQNGVLHGKHKDGAFLYQRDVRLGLTQVFHTTTFDITALSGYTNSKTNAGDIVTGEIPGSTGLPASLGTSLLAPSKTYQQELYASSTTGKIHWLVGGSFFRENGASEVSVDLPVRVSALINDAKFRDTSFAGYAQVTIPLTDKLSLTGGGRYTTEKYSIDDQIDTATTGVPNAGSPGRRFNKATYTGRVEYRPTSAILLYGGVTTGFKSGTFNVSNPAGGGVGPENLKSYEVGFKTDLFDKRVRFNGAGFYYDYTNIQTFQIVNGSGFLVGGLNGRVYGAEASLETRLLDNLDVGAAFSALDAKYTNNTEYNGVFLAAKGKRLAGSSKFAGNIFAAYTVPLQNHSSIVANLNLAYNSGYWFEPTNTLGTGGDTDKSFTLLNAKLTYTLTGGHLAVSVYGSNLLKADYYRAGVYSASIVPTANPSTPRQFGGTVSYKF